jgi:putative ABC transport system substrate-binding protein
MAADSRGLPGSRRQFVQGAGIIGLALLAGCGRRPGQAEPPAKVPRIGYLQTSSPADGAAQWEAFQQGLREHGLVEGHNMAIDYRSAHGEVGRLPALVAELIALPVDVLVVAAASAASAAKSATSSIPIVAIGFADPVGAGLVASLARPGGNLTGLATDTGPALAGKRLELLLEAVPGISRVAALWDPAAPGQSRRLSETQAAAQALGVAVQSVPVREFNDFDSAFEAIVRGRADAVYPLGTTVLVQNRARIAEFALQNRLPAWGGRVGSLQRLGT